jgi:hypothetical protein
MTTLTQDHRTTHTRFKTIPGLVGTATYELGIEVYQAHQDPGNGICVRCGNHHPCPSWRSAAELIAAAGDDPRRYDGPTARSPQSSTGLSPGGQWQPAGPATAGPSLHPIERPPETALAGHLGGGSRAHLDPQGYLYERDRRDDGL